jgi:hypothetical protein
VNSHKPSAIFIYIECRPDAWNTTVSEFCAGCLVMIEVNCIILLFMTTTLCWNLLFRFKSLIWKQQLFQVCIFVYTYAPANGLGHQDKHIVFHGYGEVKELLLNTELVQWGTEGEAHALGSANGTQDNKATVSVQYAYEYLLRSWPHTNESIKSHRIVTPGASHQLLLPSSRERETTAVRAFSPVIQV